MFMEEITPPSASVVSVDEIKEEVRQTSDNEDGSVLIAVRDAAIVTVEKYLRRSLINRNITLHLDARELRPIIYLWRPPIVSITSVTANLQDDSTSVLGASNYLLAGDQFVLKTYNGAVWPTTLRPIDSMVFIYVSGYGAAKTDVPMPIREGIILLAADMYEQPEELRKEILPDRVITLLASYRNMRMS